MADWGRLGGRARWIGIAVCGALGACEVVGGASDAGDATTTSATDTVDDGSAGDDATATDASTDASIDDATTTEDTSTTDAVTATGDDASATDAVTADGDGGDAPPPRDFGPPVPTDLAASLGAMVDAHFDGVKAIGAAVGVRLPDGSWWEGVRGEACVDPEATVAIGDRFRLGSITKTWVAAAVLQLVDEGEVDLDAPASDYVTGLELDPAITVRRCLSHTTGLFDLTDDVLHIGADFTQPADPREVVALSIAHGPDFAPGDSYEYSNTNYFVLGLLVEAVTGDPIATVLRSRFIDPLGLLDTFLEASEPPTTTFVCGNVSGVDITHIIDMSWAWAAGAMVSSNGDLCRWADALWRGDLVSAPLLAEMMTPTVLPDGRVTGYGLGTMVETRGGIHVVGHNGQTLGFQTELFIDPTSGLCVSVLANDFSARPEALGVPAWALLVPALGLHP